MGKNELDREEKDWTGRLIYQFRGRSGLTTGQCQHKENTFKVISKAEPIPEADD